MKTKKCTFLMNDFTNLILLPSGLLRYTSHDPMVIPRERWLNLLVQPPGSWTVYSTFLKWGMILYNTGSLKQCRNQPQFTEFRQVSGVYLRQNVSKFQIIFSYLGLGSFIKLSTTSLQSAPGFSLFLQKLKLKVLLY